MSETTALFLSSGDLLADRRYDRARGLEADGDVAAAADLLVQALERAPDFAAAWFALGEIRARGGDNAGAVARCGLSARSISAAALVSPPRHSAISAAR